MNQKGKIAGLMLSTIMLGSTLYGCVPLVAVGAVAGAGTMTYYQGVLSQDINAPVKRIYNASLQTFKDKKIFAFHDILAEKKASINGEYKDGSKVTVVIDEVTASTSRVRVVVGIKGSQEQAEDIMDSIITNL